MATRGTSAHGPARAGGIRIAGWGNVVLGIVVIAIPFATMVGGTPLWNNVIVGVLVAAFAGYNAWAATRGMTGRVVWPATVNVLLGLWLILYAFIAVAVPAAFTWANVLLGLLVAIIASYNVYAGATARESPTRRPSI